MTTDDAGMDLNLEDLLPAAQSAGVQPGDRLHALRSVSLVGSVSAYPLTLNRGDEVTATADLIRLNTDRANRCSLDDPRHFARGPAPADLLPEPGTTEWDDRHKREYEAAWKLADPRERQRELDRVRATFGRAETASRTLRSHPSV